MQLTSDMLAWAADVWQQLVPESSVMLTEPASEHDSGWIASVAICGASDATISVGCLPEFAKCVAGAILEEPPEGIDEATARDALAELANMFASRFKATLPKLCQLQLPSLAQAADWRQRTADHRAICSNTICFAGHAVTLAIWPGHL